MKRVKSGQTAGTVAKDLGLVEQTLRNWIKAADAGKLNDAHSKVVTPEQKEFPRLRAENIRLKRENEILKKPRRTSPEKYSEVAWIEAHRKNYGLDEMFRRAATAHISVIPNTALDTLRNTSFDMVINQDSFPEIHEDIVKDYLQWIQENAKYFLSINHENQPNSVKDQVQNSVPQLIRGFSSYHRKLRFPYWLRKGYVCELYKTVGREPDFLAAQ